MGPDITLIVMIDITLKVVIHVFGTGQRTHTRVS